MTDPVTEKSIGRQLSGGIGVRARGTREKF